MKLAVFDCDGTLADGQAGIVAAMDSAFADVGLVAPPAREVRRIVGLSLPQAVAVLTPDADETARAAIVSAYRHAYATARTERRLEEPLFEGVPALLERLAAGGWTFGVATGKSDRGLAALLAAHGLDGRFASLQTADRHPSKPHPAMLEAALAECGARAGEATMIGDTSFDMEMGRAAGVRAIGVGWGYHEPDELLAAGAAAVAGTVTELEALLDG